MKKMVLTLALAGALLPSGQLLHAQPLTEDDFDDHGTGLVLRPMDGAENTDGPSGVIPRARPAPQAPAPEPPRKPKKPPVDLSGRSLVQLDGKKFHGKKAVSRIELAVILDRYLDYIKQQKSEIEEKLETIPMQKGLPAGTVSQLDKLLEDLNGLSTEQVRLAKMVQDLSGTVHEQGVDIQKLKISDMVTERRLERLEGATGLAKHPASEAPPTPEEASQAEKLMDRVQRLEDLLYQSLSQLAENTTRIETIEDPKAPKTAAKPASADSRHHARIPFAAAGGITIGAEKQAYRKKLLARVKESLQDLNPSSSEGGQPKAEQPSTADDPAPSASTEDSQAPSPTANADSSEAKPASTDDVASSDTGENPEDPLPDLVEQAKGGQ
ncbi:MAG: hypothetical protein HY303_00795 [Candidatus Wallbacteria bacterium]|nr:hypothetical protein [Candidatus Wallbacteria bacterium]